jgi:hypothetical protein
MVIRAGQSLSAQGLGATRPKPVPLDFRHSRKAAAEEELRKEQEKAQHTQGLVEGVAAREREEAEEASEAEEDRSTWEQWGKIGLTVAAAAAAAAFTGPVGAGFVASTLAPALAGAGAGGLAAEGGVGIGRAIDPGPAARYAESQGESIRGRRALSGVGGAVSTLRAGGAAANIYDAEQTLASDEMLDARTEGLLAKVDLTERDMQELAFLDTGQGQKAFIEGRYPGRDRSYSSAFERYLDEQNAPRRGVYGTPAPAWHPPLR